MTMRYLVREICEAYHGLTPDDVGNMTFYQVRTLLWPKEELRGYRKYKGPIPKVDSKADGKAKAKAQAKAKEQANAEAEAQAKTRT